MVDLEKMVMGFGMAETKIKEFKVMFQTPFGLFDSPQLAVNKVLSVDMPIVATVKAVAVAVGEDDTYEVMP